MTAIAKDAFDLPVEGIPSAYLFRLREGLARSGGGSSPEAFRIRLDGLRKEACAATVAWFGGPKRFLRKAEGYGPAFAAAAKIQEDAARLAAMKEALMASGASEEDKMIEAISNGSLSAVDYLKRDGAVDSVPPFLDALMRQKAAESEKRKQATGGCGATAGNVTHNSLYYAMRDHRLSVADLSSVLHRPLLAAAIAEHPVKDGNVPPGLSNRFVTALSKVAAAAVSAVVLNPNAAYAVATEDLRTAPPLVGGALAEGVSGVAMAEEIKARSGISASAWFWLAHKMFVSGRSPETAAIEAYDYFAHQAKSEAIDAEIPLAADALSPDLSPKGRAMARRVASIEILERQARRIRKALDLGATATDFGFGLSQSGYEEAELRVRVWLRDHGLNAKVEPWMAQTAVAERMAQTAVAEKVVDQMRKPRANARCVAGLPERLLLPAEAAAIVGSRAKDVEVIARGLAARVKAVVMRRVDRADTYTAHERLEDLLDLQAKEAAARQAGLF